MNLVRPALSGHLLGPKKCVLKRAVRGTLIVRILFMTGSVTKCSVMGGERLGELLLVEFYFFICQFYNSSIMTNDIMNGVTAGLVDPRL